MSHTRIPTSENDDLAYDLTPPPQPPLETSLHYDHAHESDSDSEAEADFNDTNDETNSHHSPEAYDMDTGSTTSSHHSSSSQQPQATNSGRMGIALRDVNLDDSDDDSGDDDGDSAVSGAPLPLHVRRQRACRRRLVMCSLVMVVLGALAVVKFGGFSSTSVSNEEDDKALLSQQSEVHDEAGFNRIKFDQNNGQPGDKFSEESLNVAAEDVGGDESPEQQSQDLDTVNNNDSAEAELLGKYVCDPRDELPYRVLDSFDHDTTSFTQGLTYHNGLLYESTGLYGQSKLRTLSGLTGEVQTSQKIPKQFFGEGLTYYSGGRGKHKEQGRLVQITWKSNRGFVYNATDMQLMRRFNYKTFAEEGWGISFIPEWDEFVVSDGSQYLHFWDRRTFQEKRRCQVFKKRSDDLVTDINELEYVADGRMLANIWYEDDILSIHMERDLEAEAEVKKSGVKYDETSMKCRVERTFDFKELADQTVKHRDASGSVLNGISVSANKGVFYVTGKQWPTVFVVAFRDFCRD